MMVISVFNTKGGCGKTSISTGLSGAFTLRGKKVLHIDADPQGGSTLSLGLGDGASIEKSLSGVLSGQVPISDVIVEGAIEGLRGIPSSKQMERIGYMLSMQDEFGYVEALAEALKQVEKSYDYVIIDAPNQVSPIMENVAFATDVFVCPFEGVNAVERIADLEEVIEKTRPDKDYLRIDVYNNLSGRGNSTLKREVSEVFDEMNIPQPVFEIRSSIPMARVGREGGSVCHYRPKCNAAIDIMKLTHFIEDKLGIGSFTDASVAEILAESNQ